ncbi:MAG: rubredoxin [Candidatus Aminicenantes bacterium]|nr:rubredoxin [Candidatus Aminicenantes bacterium]
MNKWECSACGYIYDEETEILPFTDLPNDWLCPVCSSPKSVFQEVE